MQHFSLRRRDLLADIDRMSGPGASVGWKLGGSPQWFINIPNVFAALARPEGSHEFIQLPARGEEHPGSATAYWASLLYLLVHSFGWKSPAHGIQWWNNNGFPTDDDRLALIKQVWVDDGMFEFFYEWLMRFPWEFDPVALSNGQALEYSPYKGEQKYAINGTLPSMEGYHLPYGGGTDPLHLVHHVSPSSAESTDDCTLLLANDGSPSGVLVSDSLSSWWAFLRTSESAAGGHRSGRSWRVEVFVRRVGYIGTFRRSRETGRWFAGKHRYHVIGNPST